MNTINDRVIRTTIEKQRESKSDLYRALLVANCYDQILYHKPVDTLRIMNIPKTQMRDVLVDLILMQRTVPEKTNGAFQF